MRLPLAAVLRFASLDFKVDFSHTDLNLPQLRILRVGELTLFAAGGIDDALCLRSKASLLVTQFGDTIFFCHNVLDIKKLFCFGVILFTAATLLLLQLFLGLLLAAHGNRSRRIRSAIYGRHIEYLRDFEDAAAPDAVIAPLPLILLNGKGKGALIDLTAPEILFEFMPDCRVRPLEAIFQSSVIDRKFQTAIAILRPSENSALNRMVQQGKYVAAFQNPIQSPRLDSFVERQPVRLRIEEHGITLDHTLLRGEAHFTLDIPDFSFHYSRF